MASLWALDCMASLRALNDMSSLWALDGMSSKIFHFVSPSPQSNRSLYSDLPLSQQFWQPPHIFHLSCWGGGGCFCCHYPPTHLHLCCYSRTLSLQCQCLFRQHILHRSCGSVPPISTCYRPIPPCYFTSVLCRIPNLRHHWIYSSLTGPGHPCRSWCNTAPPPDSVPAGAHVSACRTLRNPLLSGSVDRSSYHPLPRGIRGSLNMPPPSFLPVSPWSPAAGLLRFWTPLLVNLPRRSSLLQYHIRRVSSVTTPLDISNPPITASRSTNSLSPPSSEDPQTPWGPPTTRPLRWLCCRSIKTYEHICGCDPSNPPQSEDPLQSTCHIAARSGQCDAATSPKISKSGSPLPGSTLLTSQSFSSSVSVLVWTRGRGTSGLVACPLLILIKGHIPLTGLIGSSLPAAGCLRVLQNMEGSVEAIVPLASLVPLLPGCALGGGPDRSRWVDKVYSLSRSGQNWFGGPSRSLRWGSSGGWEAARSEWRLRWWHSPPGWRAGLSARYGPIPWSPFLPRAGRRWWGGALPRFVAWSPRRSRRQWDPCGLVGLAWSAWGGWCLSSNRTIRAHEWCHFESWWLDCNDL